jgi:hypothetical protein
MRQDRGKQVASSRRRVRIRASRRTGRSCLGHGGERAKRAGKKRMKR